jgi:hypothetical protein
MSGDILPLTMSKMIRSQQVSNFMISFTSSVNAVPTASITVQGLYDFVLQPISSRCTANGDLFSSRASYSSPFLSIFIATAGFAPASSAIICNVTGLIPPSRAAAAKNDIVISTFSADQSPVDTLAGVLLPPIFAGEASDVSVTLSSVISASAGVTMTLSFISPNSLPGLGPKGSIKTISVTGVFFESGINQAVVCRSSPGGTSSGFLSFSNSTLVIRLSASGIPPSSNVPVTCDLPGFTNFHTLRAAEASVALTTWDAFNVPIDISANVFFPDIFAFSAINGSISLSSQVISKTDVRLTLEFYVPYTGRSINRILVSGVKFSASPSVSGECSMDLQSYPASTTFKAAADSTDTIELTVSLPVGSELLAVTCTLSNFVNSPTVRSQSQTVSIAIFDSVKAPLYTQSNMIFPAIFDQGLGSKRPRVCQNLLCT